MVFCATVGPPVFSVADKRIRKGVHGIDSRFVFHVDQEGDVEIAASDMAASISGPRRKPPSRMISIVPPRLSAE
jgi:hypothetical protein